MCTIRKNAAYLFQKEYEFSMVQIGVKLSSTDESFCEFLAAEGW